LDHKYCAVLNMAAISTRRLSKELKEIHAEGCPVGINLVSADNFECWHFTIEVMGDSLYKEEVFTLKFRFEPTYPIASPAVQFVVGNDKVAPVHPHVYSNGHICASILGNEWSPVLGVISICVTLQSMLASCKKKERPPDNDRYIKHAPDNPKKTRFEYHDDDV
jgi:ubiquitin-conjugating enzyme E2 W